MSTDAPLLQNFINGQFVPARGTATFDVINPTNGETVAKAPISNADDVDEAMKAAAEAFKTFKRTTPSERQAILLKVADAMEANSEALVEAQHRNTGQVKSIIADEEVAVGADQVRFFAGAARTLEGKSAGEYMEGFTSYVRREPVGVIAQVTPWNYPLLMFIWKIAPAIAAGNTIVLKPSDTTPESTLEFMRITQDIIPAGVLNIVLGDAKTGETMTTHPTPAMASITGSVRAGKAVAQAAATSNPIKKSHLELGGKAPAVVFADADLEATAKAMAEFGFFNAGQDCTAITRVLVQDSAVEEMKKLMTAAAKATPTGNADDSENYYGPLNNINHFNTVSAALDALPEHANILTGGERVGDKGYFFAPTVVADVNQDDEIVQNEVFGPVLTIQSFSTEEEAIELANGVGYGLASCVWTSDHGTAMRVSRDLDFGAVWVNTHVMLTAEMPHGGFKNSGYGKDLSLYGLEDYTRIKHVMHAL